MNFNLTPADFTDSINKAINFLYDKQLTDGEFNVYVWAGEDMHDCDVDSTPYVTALMLYSLDFWQPNEKVETILQKGINFLLSQMEGEGNWRYWTSKNKKWDLIPHDLDTMSCVSYLLKTQGVTFPNNIPTFLENTTEEGLFYTWIFPRSIYLPEIQDKFKTIVNPEARVYITFAGIADDIDHIVNANTLLYLGDNEHTKPAQQYLINAVLNNSEHESIYIVDDFAVYIYYMISRAYRHSVPALGVINTTMADRIIAAQNENGGFGSDWETGMALCTLLNIDGYQEVIARGIHHLLTTQQPDGSWLKGPVYTETDGPFFGSREFTTAFCIEALSKYYTQYLKT